LSGNATKVDLANYKLKDNNAVLATDNTYGRYMSTILGLILIILI